MAVTLGKSLLRAGESRKKAQGRGRKAKCTQDSLSLAIPHPHPAHTLSQWPAYLPQTRPRKQDNIQAPERFTH